MPYNDNNVRRSTKIKFKIPIQALQDTVTYNQQKLSASPPYVSNTYGHRALNGEVQELQKKLGENTIETLKTKLQGLGDIHKLNEKLDGDDLPLSKKLQEVQKLNDKLDGPTDLQKISSVQKLNAGIGGHKKLDDELNSVQTLDDQVSSDQPLDDALSNTEQLDAIQSLNKKLSENTIGTINEKLQGSEDMEELSKKLTASDQPLSEKIEDIQELNKKLNGPTDVQKLQDPGLAQKLTCPGCWRRKRSV